MYIICIIIHFARWLVISCLPRGFVCVLWYVCGCVFFFVGLPSLRAILAHEWLVNGGLWLLQCWADSLMYLSQDQVTDFMPRPRHATQIRAQEVLPNYPARTALCLLAGAVTGLHPDLTWRFLSPSQPSWQLDSHNMMVYTFICLSLSTWVLRLATSLAVRKVHHFAPD